MAYLANALKEDLRTLALELGENVTEEMKIIHLRNIILRSPEYEEEFVKNLLNTIINSRQEKESRGQEIKKQDLEERRLREKREFELKILELQLRNQWPSEDAIDKTGDAMVDTSEGHSPTEAEDEEESHSEEEECGEGDTPEAFTSGAIRVGETKAVGVRNEPVKDEGETKLSEMTPVFVKVVHTRAYEEKRKRETEDSEVQEMEKGIRQNDLGIRDETVLSPAFGKTLPQGSGDQIVDEWIELSEKFKVVNSEIEMGSSTLFTESTLNDSLLLLNRLF